MAARLPTPGMDDELAVAARAGVPVLITCASPTARERCARLIHAQSCCRSGPFVTFRGNGAARRGSASDAQNDQQVVRSLHERFAEAHEGSLFIEDVATTSAGMQLALFELLETASGRCTAHRVQVIAGASRRLDGARASGAFSDALFYRLNVVHLDFTRSRAVESATIERTMANGTAVPRRPR